MAKDNGNVNEIWNIVKVFRKKFYLNFYVHNNCDNSMLKSNFISNLTDAIEQNQNLSSSRELYGNVSQETFEIAGKIFTYLGFCPSATHELYKDLFYESPKEIISAMISILKTSRNADKKSAYKIFLKVAEKLKINNYKNIKDLNDGNCTKDCNESFNVLGKIFIFIIVLL